MILVPSTIVLLFIAFLTYPTPGESLKCYECSGNESCGKGQSDPIVDCTGKCMSYRNEDNNGKIVRRCCSTNCDQGRHSAYFCSKDMCNGIHSDRKLLVKINANPRILSKEDQSESLSCYDCNAHNPECGVSTTTLAHGCRACMVYQNAYDGNNVIRRCCTSGCGTPGTVGEFEGRKTYFCSSNQCNGVGAEKVLTESTTTKITTLSSTTTPTTTTLSTTSTTITMTIPTTIISTTIQTSSSCYDCSGLTEQECTTITSNCPMCMIYRNDNDPTKFDRRCCWWSWGAPNQVTAYSGRPTYFCAGDKCNGYAAELALGSSVTTTTTITTTPMTTNPSTTTTTATSSICELNCQNGGTPETEDGCFCYCLENITGRECETVNCPQSDMNSETCTLENEPLCEESETFAFECLHLCRKC